MLSLLARAMPSESLSVLQGETQPGELLLVLIMGGSLMGSAAAERESADERAAYLGSKVSVLSAACGAQPALFASRESASSAPRRVEPSV